MRTRQHSYETDEGQITTHCTIDTGNNTPQTSVIFRSGAWGCDIMSVTRPFPKSTQGSFDSSNRWSYEV